MSPVLADSPPQNTILVACRCPMDLLFVYCSHTVVSLSVLCITASHVRKEGTHPVCVLLWTSAVQVAVLLLATGACVTSLRYRGWFRTAYLEHRLR